MDTDVATRVANLTDSITFQVYQYTTRYYLKSNSTLTVFRGLFECDKLIFTAQMAFQILLMKEEISPVELDFLLRWTLKGDSLSGSLLLLTLRVLWTSSQTLAGEP